MGYERPTVYQLTPDYVFTSLSIYSYLRDFIICGKRQYNPRNALKLIRFSSVFDFQRSNSHDGFGSSGDSGDGSHHDTHDDHSSEYGQIGYHGDGSSAGDYSAHHGYNSYNEDDLGGYGDDNYGRYDDKDNYEYGNDDEKHYGSSYPYNAARSESKDNFHSSEPPMFARINYKGFNSKK